MSPESRLIELALPALVAMDFTTGSRFRHWLNEDEYLIRHRIHADFKRIVGDAMLRQQPFGSARWRIGCRGRSAPSDPPPASVAAPPCPVPRPPAGSSSARPWPSRRPSTSTGPR